MGVDVTSVSGIGVYITNEDIVKVSKEFSNPNGIYNTSWDEFCDADLTIGELLENIEFPDFINYGEYGSYFSGETDFVLLMVDPLKDGYNLCDRVEEFYDWVSEAGFGVREVELIGEVLRS